MASLHSRKNGGSNLRDSMSKKQNNGVEETLDRFIQLPDALLVQILSLLPTKDAVASCVLSKRTNLYCSSLITLNLSHWVFDKGLAIVWNSLKRLNLYLISLDDDDIVNLLSGCPALETLELSFFGGFSRLEIKSSNLKRLTLAGHWQPDAENDGSLEIIAPYLQHLEISGNFYNLMCRLVDVSSLVNAKLTFNNKCIKGIGALGTGGFDDEEENCDYSHQVLRTLVQDYLHKLSYATELSIGNCFREVLCALKFEGVPWVLIPDLKCKYLTLELLIGEFNLHGVAGLLRASPHADTLNIDIAIMPYDSSCRRFESRYSAKGDNNDMESRISSFQFPNLKNVKIGISFGVCLKYSFQWQLRKLFKLSEFLLKSSTILEKFTITSEKRKCKRCSMNCESPLLSQLAEKLLGCARSYADPVIIFQE
ncbi:probable F-box protein At1g60180 [Nicotiana sylvestris]|uniref:Probable F-box protein At1g60180 n=1 Tax=Nicotiana sylvestris TaxID=4096 RepID=A0A1U7W084_NICSY|nr:PREDICTED: probable F-box protein At1g60180 [Nicotiana sylvestris]